MTTHYEILGIERTANGAEIRAAYVRLIKEAHPDVNHELDDSTERAILIVEAYAVLRDKKRRTEYDQGLDGKRSETKRASTQRDTQRPSRPISRPEWMDATVAIACAGCKREDIVLKIYRFAWVASFIIETRHGQDSLILCSRCHLRKSLLYTVRVMALGWWAVPIGFTLTLAGIAQNVFGGIVPKDENASLLAIHGYRLFTNGLYKEALQSFEASQALFPTRDKGNFIERLRKLSLPLTRAESLTLRLGSLNSAWFIIPLLAVVICVGLKVTSSAAAYYRSQTTAQSANAQAMPLAEAHQLNVEAQQANFDLVRFNGDCDGCSTVVKRVAIYVHDNVPLIGVHKEGSTIVDDYAFDRENLSADILAGYTETIRNNLSDAVAEKDSNVSPTLSNGLSQYIDKQLDFMRICYFNVMVLTISVRQNNASDPFNQAAATAQSIEDLENDSLIQAWILRSGNAVPLENVMKVISREEQAESLKADIASSQATASQLQQQINDYQSTMDSAKSSGDMTSYNFLVPTYNKDLSTANAENAALNTKINLYNALARSLNKNPTNDAFNKCINGNILLNKFDFVDIKATAPKFQ